MTKGRGHSRKVVGKSNLPREERVVVDPVPTAVEDAQGRGQGGQSFTGYNT